MICVMVDGDPCRGLPPEMTLADGVQEMSWLLIVNATYSQSNPVAGRKSDGGGHDIDVELIYSSRLQRFAPGVGMG